MKHRGILKITLKSDLCPGSGYAYAGVIDSDVAYDANGIPFISGRSIKGCMRECAVKFGLIDECHAQSLFGKRGSNKTTGIVIENAFPKDTTQLKEFLTILKELNDNDAKEFPEIKYMTPDGVLNLFTSIRSQTRIDRETGVADDKTLRFTRVINHHKHDSSDEQVFEAKIDFDGKQKDWEIIKNIALATRNIGMNRNRGLGSVRMKIEDVSVMPQNQRKIKIPTYNKSSEYQKITYRLYNDEPLMMSGNQDATSRNYINGGSVLGAFAAEYLKEGKPTDTAFIDIFLKGSARFSNLIITIPDRSGENVRWMNFIPSPLYLNRLKKKNVLVNLAAEKQWSKGLGLPDDYNPGNGNQPKKLTGTFAHIEGDSAYVTEIKRNLIYHHSHTGVSLNGENGLLYSSEVVSAGHYFTGSVIVKTQYVELAYKLLKTADFSFGKSKSAQYGHCTLQADPIISEYTEEISAKDLKSGSRIMVNFISDAVFLTEDGSYTVNTEKIREILISSIGLDALKTDVCDQSWVTPCEITGYNSVWNLKKEAIPAIAMGSALTFTLKKDLEEWPEFVGEKNIEGFGQIRVDLLSGRSYAVNKMEMMSRRNDRFDDLKTDDFIHKACLHVLEEQYKKELGKKAFDESTINISSAALGRLTLMLEEAVNDAPGNVWLQYLSLRKRIASIKSDKTNKNIMNFLSKILGKDNLGQPSGKKVSINDYYDQTSEQKKEKQMKIIVDHISDTELGKLIKSEFPTEASDAIFSLSLCYLKDVLVYQKYRKKEQSND